MIHFARILTAITIYSIIILPLHASTQLPEAVQEHAATSSLLQKRVVRLQSAGQADLSFQIAIDIIHDDDVLFALQKAYAMMLPEGESPEFTVEQIAPGQYAYVNRDGEKTQISEVHRVSTPDSVALYIFSEGDRFFGKFEALTAITVKPIDNNQVVWQVKVYAYPYNALSRLVARTGVVNRFFRNKTHEITGIALKIGTFMTEQ